jgi:hypothetical protein
MDATLLLTSAVLAAVPVMGPVAGPVMGLVVGVVVGLVVGLGAAVLLTLAGRRRVEGELRASRAELAALSARLQEVSATLGAGRAAETADRTDRAAESTGPLDVPDTRFLITSLAGDPSRPGDSLPARRFASVATGESLVRLLSLGYGVRRALSPHNRNRIRFEMRQEVRRSRRRRRDEVREARRLVRARQAGLAQDDAA